MFPLKTEFATEDSQKYELLCELEKDVIATHQRSLEKENQKRKSS